VEHRAPTSLKDIERLESESDEGGDVVAG